MKISNINDTTYDVPFVPVTKMFEQCVSNHPNKTAVVSQGMTITYNDLNKAINKVANTLISKGSGREKIVAVMVERGIDTYIAREAVLKSGGAFVYISSQYPEDRIKFILEDSNAAFIILDKPSAELYSKYNCNCESLLLDDILKNDNDKNPNVEIYPEDLCYCIYTSGSTGTPKGVMIEHGNLSNFVISHKKNTETVGIVNHSSVMLALAAMTFDVSIMEEFIPLTNGMTTVIASDEEIQNLDMLSETMIKNGVDALCTTPSFMSLMLEIPSTRKALTNVKVLDIGAEAFPSGLYKKISEVAPKIKILNGYGPTETTISCTVKEITSDENITIGKPNGNVYAYIIDENGSEVPLGEKGELLICGKGVGRGYINLPEKTAEVFIEFNGMRAYKTGDIARINSDGEIEFHGRRDNQVKLRGLRIELGEVEKVIGDFPTITSCVVIAVDNSYLCAYFTASSTVDTDELAAFASERLAYYMVPDIFISLDEMPLTDNKKIDKKALPKPVLKQGCEDVPKNAIQQKIFNIVSEIVGNTAFGINTPFTKAGLSSLGAMKLNVLLSNEFGVVVKTGDIHTYNTVVLLEEFIKTAEIPDKLEKRDIYPLTGSQKGIFAECMKNPESTVYNIPFLFKLDSGIDTEKLAYAIQKTVAAHSYMNTRISILDNGEISQTPFEDSFSPNITVLSDDEFTKRKAELVKPFAICNDRLYRIEIFKTENLNYLFVDFHHIMADGNSYDVFFQDLNRAYLGESLTAETFTGFDAAVNEEKEIEKGKYNKAALYFDSIFSDIEIESLPIFDKKAGTPTKGILRRKSSLSTEKAKAICESLAVTPNIFFTGVFGILTSRLSNSHDALFATIYNGRNDSRLENTVCMLVKTLPVYTKFDNKTTISAFMGDLQKQLMSSMANDIFPFSDIAAKYGITADLIFAYQAELSDDYPIGEYTAHGEDLSLDLPKEPLLIQVRMYNGKYYLDAEYRSDLYNESTIEMILDSYDAALLSACNERTVSDVTILSDKQRIMLEKFNNTDIETNDETVVDMFERCVKKFHDKTAIVYKNTVLNYSELYNIASRLAGYIHSKGMKAEDTIAVMIPRNEFMPICAIGVAMSGCAYQPLDSSYPQERLHFMLTDSNAKLLVTTQEMRSLIPEYTGDVLYLDEIQALPQPQFDLPKPKSEDLFILLYTSGSTGVPKGVMIEFGNISAFCKQYSKLYELTSESKCIAYASFGFDASMMDIFTPLTVGAELHIISEEIRLNLLALNDYFNENQITHAFMTTQVGRQFAMSVENNTLKYLSMGGEKLVPLEPPKNYTLVNLYGPTEATVFITSFMLDKFYDDIPIGKANRNVKLYVTDDKGHLLPPIACGELYVSGVQVVRGYLNQPEKTAAVFIDNPFDNDKKYRRVYRTGDIVRYLTDGNISFVGRCDSQVKIRGFRIELTEIEEVIRRFAGIKDATVVAFDDDNGGKFIAAYVVADEPVDHEKLAAFIMSEKPPYMVPTAIEQIDAIPLNPNQKVNKKALPKPKRTTAEIVAPKNEMQQKIFDIVCEAIGHDNFGITTDIYFAGLTSISSIRLNVLLAKAFDIVIKTSDIKENPTVEKLEKFILSASGIQSHAICESYPLTTSQQGVFVDCMANMGTTVYNIPYLFKLSNKINLLKLKSAIENTVKAHSYLKVRLFMDKNGDIRQKRDDNSKFTVEIKSEMDKTKLVRPFQLFNENLARFELYRCFDANYLFIDLHHLIADGTSYEIILNEITRAYLGQCLEPERYSSYDLAIDSENAQKSGDYKKAQEFFKKTFCDCGGNTDFYPDKSETEPKIGTVVHISKTLDSLSVKKICEKYGITENVFFIAAFGAMLARYHFSDTSVFTTIYHGRNDSRLSDTVGMLVKTLPVICKTNNNLENYFKAVQSQLMGMMNNDIYPFSEISRNFDIKPNILLVYQGESFKFDSLCGEPVEEISLNLNAAKAPISFMITLTQNGYEFELEYRADMYHRETVQWIIENFEISAQSLIDEKNPQDIRLLFDEKDKMVDLPLFKNKTYIQIFEETVKKYPDNIAVKDEFGSITYKQLDEASNLVAEKLCRNGFGTEKIASILCGRVKEFAVAVFGIMKAGGAYVPLDPEYPKDRLDYMLHDSGSENLLVMNELVPLADFYTGNMIILDNIIEESNGFTSTIELPSAKPENLAYMIYTSGSTGKPKGVMIEHRNLVNLMQHNFVQYKPTENDMVGVFSSFCFDASVTAFFIPFTVGGSAYIFAESVRKDALAIAEVFRKEPITICVMPTQMGEITAQILSEECALRILILGGEKLKRFYHKKFTMFNGYGPTENTVASTEFKVDKEYANIPIGSSVLNVRSYIVDENMKRVPIGASGELCHAGRQVSRGYHNLPEKTATSFVINPFAKNTEEARMYRTGDMVRMKGDGNIEYIGRIDSQVKIRGYRVELGEIEGAILKADGVDEVAVIAIEMNGVNTISAYYTGSYLNETELRTFIKPLLPDYMMPSFITHLEKMPVTPGGKIDKRSLPKPESSSEKANYTAPQNAEQEKICELFAKALGIEKIGIDDDFFENGGSSLSASKVAVMALTENLPIIYADIFKYPTVRQLSNFIYGDSKQEQNKDEFSKYVYDNINEVIKKNNLGNINLTEYSDIGNLLLTGATGFLGIHVLKNYIDTCNGKAYCLVRKGSYESSEKRLMNMLMYYFDNPFTELFQDRIICIDGDITDKASIDILSKIPFDTLINCAACVKHFVSGNILEQSNVKGVENLIEVCKLTGKRLVQISTVSVGGEGMDGNPPENRVIHENDLYFGQRITNEYIRTKFLAERTVLEAVANGLDAKIVRVGNLMSRHSDGEFQINFITNGFLRTLRGYKAVNAFPISAMGESQEFSPIDSTAQAVLKLSGSNCEFTVFHACNSHRIFMGDVIYAMKEHGFDIAIVSDDKFADIVNKYAETHEESDAISGLIAYTSHDENSIYTIDYSNQFTTEVLYRLGFRWNITDDNYLESAICVLDGLDFFEDDFYSKN